MGSSNSSSAKPIDDEDEKTYPMKYNTDLNSNVNNVIIYKDLDIETFELMLDSLGGLPVTSDFTLIFLNKLTVKKTSSSRLMKHEFIYNKVKYDAAKITNSEILSKLEPASVVKDDKKEVKNDKSETLKETDNKNDTNDPKTKDTASKDTVTEETIEEEKVESLDMEGVVTIFSTVLKSISEQEIQLQYSRTDPNDFPKMLIKISDTPNNEEYYDVRITSDWSELHVPEMTNKKMKTLAKKTTSKLFVEELKSNTIIELELKRYGVTPSYLEKFDYLVGVSYDNWKVLVGHLMVSSNRPGVMVVYKNSTKNKYITNGMMRFGNYLAKLNNRKFENLNDELFVYGHDKISNYIASFKNKSIKLNDEKSSETDFELKGSSIKPVKVHKGFLYSVPFITEANDNCTQIYGTEELIPSNTVAFEYYHGTIQVKKEAYVLGAILNMNKPFPKKFTYYVDPPLVDTDLLDYIKNHKYIKYVDNYLTNIPNLESKLNILSDKSYLIVSTKEDDKIGNVDIKLNKKKMETIRGNNQLTANALFQSFPKVINKGYFIPAPFLKVEEPFGNLDNIYVLTSKITNVGALWNFARMTKYFVKINVDSKLVKNGSVTTNIVNWVYLAQNLTKASLKQFRDCDDFNVLDLDLDYAAIYPKTINSVDGTIAFTKGTKSLIISLNGTDRTITFDSPAVDVVETIGISSNTKSPGDSWEYNEYNEMWIFKSQSFNIAILEAKITGGPINPLIIALQKTVLTEPVFLSTSSRFLIDEQLQTYVIIRYLPENLLEPYLGLFEDYLGTNKKLNFAIFISTDLKNITTKIESLIKIGKIIKDDAKNIAVIYYTTTTNSFDINKKTITANGFIPVTFNTIKANLTSEEDAKASVENFNKKNPEIFLEEFVNKNDRKSMIENINMGINKTCHIGRTDLFTYSGEKLVLSVKKINQDTYENDSRNKNNGNEIRDGYGSLCITAIKEYYFYTWNILGIIKKSGKHGKPQSYEGAFMLLFAFHDSNQKIRYPLMEKLIKVFLGNDINTGITKNNVIIASDTTFTINKNRINSVINEIDIYSGYDQYTVKNLTYDVNSDTFVSSSLLKYTYKNFTTFAGNTKQVVLEEPNKPISIIYEGKSLTNILTFVILEKVSQEEIEYLNDIYSSAIDLTSIIYIVTESEIIQKLNNIKSYGNFHIVYNSSYYNINITQEQISKEKPFNYLKIIIGRGNITRATIGVVFKKDQYSEKELESLKEKKDVEFIINPIEGKLFNTGYHILKTKPYVFVDVIPNVLSISDIYSKSKQQIKFTRELNKYIQYVPYVDIEFEAIGGIEEQVIGVVEIVSNNPSITSIHWSSIVSVLAQLKHRYAKSIIGFYGCTKCTIDTTRNDLSKIIDNLNIDGNQLETQTQIFNYPVAKRKVATTIYLHEELPLVLVPSETVLPSLPGGSQTALYINTVHREKIVAHPSDTKIVGPKTTVNYDGYKYTFKFYSVYRTRQ